jgi:PRC-barrel domain
MTVRLRAGAGFRGMMANGRDGEGGIMHGPILLSAVASIVLLTTALHAAPIDRRLVLAQQTAAPAQADASKPAKVDNSPEARMNRRFPQKVRVGDLIGLPVLDDNDVTLGDVQKVVRTPDGKIKLIVAYSRWFGWFGRPVAVPIEVVTILARQLDSVDMEPPEYAKAPTWMPGKDQVIPDNDTIRIALGRR